ncbi:MAG: endonuclease [Chitinophagaceae bacterium]|nr:endonuclease [Chitinophagaceae bacterium]
MIKFLRIASLFLLFKTATAQIPAGYYTPANGLTCAPLKTALFNIISTGTSVVSNSNVLVAFSSTDVHRNDANTADIIWDIYSDNPTGPEVFTYTSQVDNCGGSIPGEGSCYNREHTFPQAWFSSAAPAVTDLYALYPTDGYSNGQHGNYPYSEVTSPTYTSVNGAKLGTNTVAGFPTSGVAGRAFEVRNEYKGDIARNYFYMVTRYENDMSTWKTNSNADDVLDGTTWPSLDAWYIKLMYKWHLLDPVSQKEIDRNNAVYALQQNRNPFIDHPEYVALIWQCTGLLPVTITDFTAVKNSNDVLLQWNVSAETNFSQYIVERSADGVSFSTVGSVNAANRTVYTLTDMDLPTATTVFYRLKMVDIDGHFTYSKTVSVRLNPKTGGITIYPNPAVNEVSVVLQQALQSNAVIRITDVTGRELLRQPVTTAQNNIKVSVNQLPAGRYFVSVISNGNLLHDSFVIVR